MNAQDVALWIGIASSIGGVAVGYGTLNEKVSQLEASTDATHLEARLTKLEVRIEDNDIGSISTEIEQLRGQVKANADKVASIRIPSTGQIKSDVRVLQTEVSSVQEELKGLEIRLEKAVNKPKNPLL
tara:strand:+ start:3485 stop:3868 length:384 start_codon:yes stop_codon:yes gene_type:complete